MELFPVLLYKQKREIYIFKLAFIISLPIMKTDNVNEVDVVSCQFQFIICIKILANERYNIVFLFSYIHYLSSNDLTRSQTINGRFSRSLYVGNRTLYLSLVGAAILKSMIDVGQYRNVP